MAASISRRASVNSVSGAIATSRALRAQDQRKPNLLFVFSDQHRACSLPDDPFNDAEAPTLTGP